MHIPDGFVTTQTAVATSVVSAGGIGLSLRAAAARLDDRQVPLVGLTAAFVFAAQMLNFPVGVGVSGHLIGGALAAILLGPWMASLVLGVVLIVQAVGFADGGITALGANVSLMGLVAGVGGYWIFRALMTVLPRSRASFLASTAITAWSTVVLASALCAFYLAAAIPEVSAGVIYTAMLSVHALIGIGEAVITTAVVAAVISTRPDLVHTADLLGGAPPERRGSLRGFVMIGVGVTLLAGMVLSNFADSSPDGMEAAVLQSVCDGEEACLEELAGEPVLGASPLPDYEITWLSGLVGAAAAFCVGGGAVSVLRARRARSRVRTPVG